MAIAANDRDWPIIANRPLVNWGLMRSEVGKEMVRAEGLEPPRLSSPEPKSGASTNSATPAAKRRLDEADLLSGLYISLSVLRHKKMALVRPAGSCAHDGGDGNGEEARHEQKAGRAAGVPVEERRERKCPANSGKT